MTNRELGNAIREELKRGGFTNKDISVRVRDFLNNTTFGIRVSIRIKNPLVKISEVESITKKFEKIDYDMHTMEVLSGGNTYVDCQYEHGIMERAASALIPTAEMVLNSPKYDGHAIARNAEKTVHLTKYSDNEWRLSEFGKSEGYGSKPAFWVRSAEDLAVAMFKFKNFGTIYA